MALFGSVVGDLVATTVLILLAERLARLSLEFGPAELTAVIVLSLTLVVAVAGRSLAKGLMAATFGALLAVIGTDSITGTPRLIFGVMPLLSGIGLVPMIMGLFAVSEILLLAEDRPLTRMGAALDLRRESAENRRLSLGELWRTRGALARGSAVGVVIGIIPGLGASVAAMLGYGLARRYSRTPEAFGQGSLEGVAAPEAANNAETSGALLPFIVLGIPGSSLVAMLGGAFLVHGMEPGPLLFQAHGDKMYAVYFGLYAVNFVMLAFGLGCMGLFHYIVKVPRDILLAAVFVLSVVGTYAIEASLTDVWVMLIFGLIGYVMRRMDVPTAPLLIAFLLVPQLEHSLRQALLISGGSLAIFAERPIAVGILLATVAWLAYRLYRGRVSVRA